MNLRIANINVENNTCEKLLGVEIANKLNFNGNLDGMIKKKKLQSFHNLIYHM